MDKGTVSACDANPSCKPLVVGVVGGSGSGKTTFAERLRSRLGADSVVISHDDYYKDMSHMTDEEAAVYDFDCPDAFETDLLVEHLRTLAGGKAVDVPSYDYATHARIDGFQRIEPVRVVIVEGILVMCDPALRSLFDITVFVDADDDTRLQRRIERDCRERGATLESAMQMYYEIAKPAHDKFVEPFKNDADMVIFDAMDQEALELVVAAIEACQESKIDR